MEHPELALTLPVKIPYEVLEEHLREKLVGEMIKKKKMMVRRVIMRRFSMQVCTTVISQNLTWR